MSLLRLMGLLLCLLASSAALAETLVINFDDSNPPFMYANGTTAVGIYPALIAVAFRHLKQPVSLQARPWSRCLLELDLGNAGLGGIYLNPSRAEKYDFSAPIWSERLGVYFQSAKPVSFTRLEDLNGLRVGVLRGWSYGEKFDEAQRTGVFVTESAPSDELNFRKLELGRLDVLIAVREAGDSLMRKHPTIEVSPQLLLINPTYLAFSKSSGHADLLHQFDEVLHEMRASGEFVRIVRQASRAD